MIRCDLKKTILYGLLNSFNVHRDIQGVYFKISTLNIPKSVDLRKNAELRSGVSFFEIGSRFRDNYKIFFFVYERYLLKFQILNLLLALLRIPLIIN